MTQFAIRVVIFAGFVCMESMASVSVVRGEMLMIFSTVVDIVMSLSADCMKNNLNWKVQRNYKMAGEEQNDRGGCHMAMGIINVHTEDLPALRLIGKRYTDSKEFPAKWNEWFANGWFEQLQKLCVAPENGDAYCGATGEDGSCYWIGLLFLPSTPVPDGFEHAEIPAARYAVLALGGKKAGELLGEDGITLVLEELRRRGMIPREGGWGIDRYRRTGEGSNVLFEFLIAIN